ncbi:MAG: DNA mismatch repair endonuclease MutL [Polyangiaceae bacterium]|nr:DNA mismatch repair endonuclease MutL [Polyangiaceae bacterium]
MATSGPMKAQPTRRKIHVLPDDLANQIAAGEVVERPSSIIKELVENSLDAGARKVRVDIEGGGISLARVADDGSGMDRRDAELCLLRHATSKIETLADLAGVQSFGFRGEALPSIASVSRLVLQTRRESDPEGTEVRVEGGGERVTLPCGVSVGTVVEVRDLFFNVPARRKFLRAAATESAHVTDVVQAMALGAPATSIVLSRDGRVAREWLRTTSREERARQILSGEELAACRGARGPLSVEAFLSRPERARSGAVGLTLLVNGRVVKDRSLARSVALAYGSVLEPGRYPIGVVYIDLPPELVDVNVHPQKAEVRFADGRAASDAVYRILADALTHAFGLPISRLPGAHHHKPKTAELAPSESWSWESGAAVGPTVTPPSVENRQYSGPPIDAPEVADLHLEKSGSFDGGPEAPMRVQPVPYLPIQVPEPHPIEVVNTVDQRTPFDALNYLGQLRATFLLCEGPDGLYILDQHAAAERVTYHRLRTAYNQKAVATQKLLFPVIVGVSAREVALVEEGEEAVRAAGFDLRPAGPTHVAVHSIPQLLVRASPEKLVRDLLAEVSHEGQRAFSGAIDLALATMACHGSIRAGERVSPDEAKALLRALDEVDFAGHCPHGRPVVHRVSYGELELRVGRR